MFRSIWKSIQFGNPGRPKRHKYHNSWKRNTLQLLVFWGLNDACSIKCLHKFARWCFHNNEKPGGGFAYKSNAFSMISIILGAHNSPPNTYFVIILFLEITYWPKLNTLNLQLCYKEFTSPIHKNHTPKKQWNNKQNPNAPTRHWKSPKLQNLCMCTVFAS